MKQGIIVLMNGTSSAGKTSISKEMLNQKEILFLHLSVDDFIKDYFQNKFSDIEPTREVEEHVIFQIMLDPLAKLYYSTIKLYSEMGLNVIVDTVIENDKWLNECIDLFSDHPTLFVGVICSKEELIRREQIRGDRNLGLAASQFDKVYSINEYDLEVNTEEMNPKQCADKILCFIKSNEAFTVLKKFNKKSN